MFNKMEIFNLKKSSSRLNANLHSNDWPITPICLHPRHDRPARTVTRPTLLSPKPTYKLGYKMLIPLCESGNVFPMLRAPFWTPPWGHSRRAFRAPRDETRLNLFRKFSGSRLGNFVGLVQGNSEVSFRDFSGYRLG